MISILKKFQNKKYSFINLPKEISIQNYEKALDSFRDLTSKREDILSIYQFGSVNCPGISDIDIAIIFKDQPTNNYFFNRKKLTKKENYAFFHPPSAILNQNLFENLNYLIPIFHLKKVYGKSLKLKNFKKESKLINQTLLTDTIFTKYPRIYLNILFNKKIDARLVLNTLNSLSYPILMIKELYKIKYAPWEELLKKIEKLRSSWFNIDEERRNKELIELVISSLITSMEIIELHNQELPQDIGPKKINFKDRLLQTFFLKDWDKLIALEKMLRSYKKRTPCSILPMNLCSQFQNYSFIENNLGKYVQQRIYHKKRHNSEQFNVQTKRLELIEEMVKFTLQKNYLHGALTPWDLGYMWHVGFKNKIKDLYYNLIG